MTNGSKPIAGVIGWPISHSRSPLMHNIWLKTYGINGTYVPVETAPEDLAHSINLLKDKGFRGVNVTVPHKEAVFDLVTAKDEAARTIGAVNTLLFEPAGLLKGLNTDAAGFVASLKGSAGVAWTQGPAVVLGAGGAARAIVYGLLEAGVQEVFVVNRTVSRAEVLARDLSGKSDHKGQWVKPHPWTSLGTLMKNCALLVNATSLGLEGGAPLEIDLDPLSPGALVTDIVYAPLETPLLREAKSKGHVVVDGLGMLIHQARFAFEAWFDILPDASPDIRAVLEADLKKSI
jgi:shikimate dehydrogenase